MTYICVENLTIIGPDNGLSSARCQAIIWPNADLLLVEPLRTNLDEISIEIHAFSFKEMHLEMFIYVRIISLVVPQLRF